MKIGSELELVVTSKGLDDALMKLYEADHVELIKPNLYVLTKEGNALGAVFVEKGEKENQWLGKGISPDGEVRNFVIYVESEFTRVPVSVQEKLGEYLGY